MRHANAFEMLPLLSLDALEEPDRSRLESHVTGCEMCRRELTRYEMVAEALAGELEPATGTWDRILARIEED